MKRKRLWIGLGVFATLILVGIVWFKLPVRLVKPEASEVGLIVLQNGDTGNRVEISDEAIIEKLMTEFRSVKMQRERLSIATGGYHIWVRVCKPDMEIIADFSLSRSGMVQEDPFFYDILKGTVDVEYLERLIEAGQDAR